MRILITGASGFIGRGLLARLASEHEIIGLVRKLPNAPRDQIHYVCQDLGQPLARHRLPAQVDAVIHQAALIDTEAVADDARPFLVNVVGTWRLLEYAADAGATTFVYASSGGIYGCGPRAFRENDPANPMDLYSLTKAQAEQAVAAAPGAFHKVILRYFFPYGVGTPNPIPGYVERAVRGLPIDVMAGGGPRLNPIHISDAIEATVAALSLQRSTTLNVAGSEVTTFAAIATQAAQMAGRQAQLRTFADEEALAYYRSDILGNIERMQAELSLQPQVGLNEGIAELVAAYLPYPMRSPSTK